VVMNSRLIAFRVDKDYMNKIESLCQITMLDQSKMMRLAIDRLTLELINKENTGEYQIVPTESLMHIKQMLGIR
jgi:hypothetical protein